jgi:hypothetical protein
MEVVDYRSIILNTKADVDYEFLVWYVLCLTASVV